MCSHDRVTTITTGSCRFVGGDVWEDLRDVTVCLVCGQKVAKAKKGEKRVGQVSNSDPRNGSTGGRVAAFCEGKMTKPWLANLSHERAGFDARYYALSGPYWKDRATEACTQLVGLLGDGYEEWIEKHVPDRATFRDIALMVEQQIKVLAGGDAPVMS